MTPPPLADWRACLVRFLWFPSVKTCPYSELWSLRSGAATWGLKGASYGSNRFEEAFKSKGSFVKCEWFFSEIVQFKLELFLCGAVVVQPFHPMDYVDYGGFHIKYLLNWWHTMSQCFFFPILPVRCWDFHTEFSSFSSMELIHSLLWFMFFNDCSSQSDSDPSLVLF